uniref:BTB domain-containing protein n=1 Tax=Parastrongyloides trichosuri TaxID=131310 RepID=A0A0N4Z3I9_PARTI
MSIANSNTFSESSEIHLNESKWLEEYKNIVRKKQLKQGKIKLELTSLSNVGGVYSSIVRIQNFAWGIGADIKSKANKEFLVIGIRCVPRTSSHLWSCLTELGIRIKNYTDRGKDIVKFINHEFDCNNNCFGIYFVEKEILESEKNGYYQDGKIIIEVQLKIYYTTGYIEQPVYDFTEFGANGNNTVLKINGNQIFVNKHYLALYSQYFENLFISNNEEPNNNIYLLENLRIADFIELLEAIYPSQKKVTEKNVKVLLELSDRFIIPSLYNKCENFLIVTKKMEWVEKIVLAERYCLSKLYEFCMGQINSVTTIKRISTSKLYNEMTMEAKVDLLNKMLELV